MPFLIKNSKGLNFEALCNLHLTFENLVGLSGGLQETFVFLRKTLAAYMQRITGQFFLDISIPLQTLEYCHYYRHKILYWLAGPVFSFAARIRGLHR